MGKESSMIELVSETKSDAGSEGRDAKETTEAVSSIKTAEMLSSKSKSKMERRSSLRCSWIYKVVLTELPQRYS